MIDRSYLVTVQREEYRRTGSFPHTAWSPVVRESYTYKVRARNSDKAMEIGKQHALILYGNNKRAGYFVEVREDPHCEWLEEMLG